MTDPRDRPDRDPKAPEEDNERPPRPEDEDPADLPEPLTGPDVSLPV